MIDVLTDRAHKIEQSTSDESKFIRGVLDIYSSELYRMYCRLMPGALEVDAWLAQLAEDAKQKRTPKS